MARDDRDIQINPSISDSKMEETEPGPPSGKPAPSKRGLSSRGPTRRTEILRAAVDVLRVSGIEGLTHRAVAEEAGVPLGSTTYYFSSRDDLLHAAIEYATDTGIVWLREWALANAGQELSRILPDMLYEYLTERRHIATFDVEIYVLAARRPEIRDHATRWSAAFIAALETFMDHDTAECVASTFNGIVLAGLASTRPPTLAECTRTLSGVLTLASYSS